MRAIREWFLRRRIRRTRIRLCFAIADRKQKLMHLIALNRQAHVS